MVIINGDTGIDTIQNSKVTSSSLAISPALTGVPMAPTASTGTNTNQIATTSFVTASPTFAGTPTAPTATAGTSTTQLATTAMVHSAITNDLNVTGTAPMYACRAWVNFNGTGTVAIRASGNVSSITDNGVGDYTLNFTTAMPDVNYSFTGSNGNLPSAVSVKMHDAVFPTIGALRIYNVGLVSGNPTLFDTSYVNINVFR